MAGERHGHGMLCVNPPLLVLSEATVTSGCRALPQQGQGGEYKRGGGQFSLFSCTLFASPYVLFTFAVRTCQVTTLRKIFLWETLTFPSPGNYMYLKANSSIPCRSHAVPPLCCDRGLEKSLSERHGRSTAGARHWHGHGMVCVNQTQPHCVHQMGKTQSKPSATRHGRGTAWALHGMCELAFTVTPTKWPRGLRRGSAAARLLKLYKVVQI
jgi:hypothetical protein